MIEKLFNRANTFQAHYVNTTYFICNGRVAAIVPSNAFVVLPERL